MSGEHKEPRLTFWQWLRYRRFLRALVRERREGLKATARRAARRVDE